MGDSEEIHVEVDVGTVDNQVSMLDLLPKIADTMAQETLRAEADPNVPPEAEARFRAATRLAQELAREIGQAQTMAPRFPLFAARPLRPGGPGTPGGPLRPGG